MPSETGGQLAAFIRETEEAGGPKPGDYPANAAGYWCEVAEFWHDKHIEQGYRLDEFRDRVFEAFGMMPEVYGEATVILRKALIAVEAPAVEEHRHNWTEREGDTQNLYCECGEISRPLSPDVEGLLPALDAQSRALNDLLDNVKLAANPAMIVEKRGP